MNIVLLGGTGLLGSYACAEAIARGHSALVVSRSAGKNPGSNRVQHILADVHALDESRLADLFAGQDALIYAIGKDDRELLDRPAYPVLHEDHVEVCNRVISAAKKAGVAKVVVYGSYFTHLDAAFPEMRLAGHHVYIRTRSEQKAMVLAHNSNSFRTLVLELPYIFASRDGKIPAWTFLFSTLYSRKGHGFFFGKGGTAVTTAQQVAAATLNALERDIQGGAYPVAGSNVTWKQFALDFKKHTGQAKPPFSLPPLAFGAFGLVDSFLNFLRGKQRGLNLARFARIQYFDAFVDPTLAMSVLGYAREDYDKEFSDMVVEWLRQNHPDSLASKET